MRWLRRTPKPLSDKAVAGALIGFKLIRSINTASHRVLAVLLVNHRICESNGRYANPVDYFIPKGFAIGGFKKPFLSP